MNTVKTFVNETLGSVRTALINGQPYFVGKDVAAALGYTDINHAILDHVDVEDRVNSKTQGQNDPELGQRGSWLINEAGMYCLILSSKLPSAKAFKRWITNEVIPAIRENGGYIDGQEYVPAEEKVKLEAEIRELHQMVSDYKYQARKNKSTIDGLVRIIENDVTGDFDKIQKDSWSGTSFYDLDVEGYDEFQQDMELFNFSDYSLMEEIKTIIQSAKKNYIDKAAEDYLVSEVSRLFIERNAR